MCSLRICNSVSTQKLRVKQYDLFQPYSIPEQPTYDTFGYSIERLIYRRKECDHATGGGKVGSHNLPNTINVIHERAAVIMIVSL